MHPLSSLWRGLAHLPDLIFPPQCAVCRAPLSSGRDIHLCGDCRANLTAVGESVCPHCGFPYPDEEVGERICGNCAETPPYFDRARAAFLYLGAGKELVLKLKFAGRTQLAPQMIALTRNLTSALPSNEDAELVLPVPLHARRLREREYNQSLLLARGLARALSLPLDYLALTRIRYTDPQTELPFNRRRENVRDAFAVKRPDRVKGRRVLLVDDVYTSGNTVNECSRKLKQAGAARVEVFTFSRAGL